MNGTFLSTIGLANILCLVLWLLTPMHAEAQGLSKAQIKAIDTAIEAEMEKQKVVGVAVGYLRNRKIVFLKGYGWADREKKVSVTTKTMFNWASNSKPILALLAMILFGQGQLDLDADVRQYVPEFSKKSAVIKMRHLLCHQSGIPHYGPDIIGVTKQYKTKLPFTDPIVALDKFSKSKLKFTPGSRVQYSSFAYVLASAVVQRAGKQDLQQQIQNRIVKPLKMKSFSMDVPYQGQKHWAAGYYRSNSGKVLRAPEYAHYWKHGAGGYKSDIEDFAKWAEALLQRKLVSKQTEAVMWQPQKTNDGKITQWGLGFVVQKQNGRLKISHNGKQTETGTRLVLYPEQGHGVVVMCNCHFANPGRFSTALYSALQRK